MEEAVIDVNGIRWVPFVQSLAFIQLLLVPTISSWAEAKCLVGVILSYASWRATLAESVGKWSPTRNLVTGTCTNPTFESDLIDDIRFYDVKLCIAALLSSWSSSSSNHSY